MNTQAQEREQFHKITFTSNPKIRRKKQRNRSVRNTCEALVESFFPATEVNYNAVKNRLIRQFDRCDRKTILSYLGRPPKRQVEKIDHMIQYQTSGVTTMKTHTFTHKLPAKKGYLELFELAELRWNDLSGECYFHLKHALQTELLPPASPQPESLEESAQQKTVYSSKAFSPPLNNNKQCREKKFLKPKLSVVVTEKERESLRGRENRLSESNNNSTELSKEEKHILGIKDG